MQTWDYGSWIKRCIYTLIVRGGFRVGAITSREELLYIVYINEEVNV